MEGKQRIEWGFMSGAGLSEARRYSLFEEGKILVIGRV